jgi:hypothetical protein
MSLGMRKDSGPSSERWARGGDGVRGGTREECLMGPGRVERDSRADSSVHSLRPWFRGGGRDGSLDPREASEYAS